MSFTTLSATQITNLCVPATPDECMHPSLVYTNTHLLKHLDLNLSDEDTRRRFFAAQPVFDDLNAYAQAYAGHQFGHFNPQLGDGRAHLIADVTATDGHVYEIGFKGSGATPFSRGGDGKAALAPMLREVLLSQAMHSLGIATTRSVAVTLTGETVLRNPPQPGAILTRLASSHIRVGTFQFFAARAQYDVVEELVHFCLARHYPEHAKSDTPALTLLQSVIARQASLIAQWMSVGFIHGVMNTDNMLIGGETIDYGPCAFMEVYNPSAVYSSIDRNGRYAYFNQPGVAQWNLSRFAETLLPLIDSDKDTAIALATEVVREFIVQYESAYRKVMQRKLGLRVDVDISEADYLIQQWLDTLQREQIDYTLAHRDLAIATVDEDEFLKRMPQFTGAKHWLERWRDRLRPSITQQDLEKVNPCMVPRNHLVEFALEQASNNNDFTAFDALLTALEAPYVIPDDARLLEPAPAGFDNAFVTYCGT